MNADTLHNTDFTKMLVQHRWLWHLVFWLLYALSRALPYYITVFYYDVRLLYFMLWQEVFFVALVYFTVWLYKRFFAVGKVRAYLLAGLLCWTLYLVFFAKSILFCVGDLPDFKESTWGGIFLNNLTKYVFTFALLTMAKYFKDSVIRQYHENQRKQLQLASELENLKAQISPHFLFNTMNNFYGLAVSKSEKLPGLMVRLSELLRYALYETRNETVPLGKDVANLLGYIELEKIRLEENLEFRFDSNIAVNCPIQIAPLLLVVFVENAFKHAKKVQGQPIQISVNLQCSDEGMLRFQVENNCAETEENPLIKSNGIGLSNVKKRLEVLYPNGQHSLEIEKKPGVFRVNLHIKLQKTPS